MTRALNATAAEVRALLAGATALVRPVRPQPDGVLCTGCESAPRVHPIDFFGPGKPWWKVGGINGAPRSPFGPPLGTLRVREAWAEFPSDGDWIYRADYAEPFAHQLRFASPARMPVEASRLYLRVLSVEVLRLTDLTAEHVAGWPTLEREGDPVAMGDVMHRGRWVELPRGLRYRDVGRDPWCWVARVERTEAR